MSDPVELVSGDFMLLADIAEIEFQSHELDGSTVTIREWLKELLCTLWFEGESFSGKRSFGNSSWQFDLYRVLVEEGIVSGTIDEFEEVDVDDYSKADKIILDIIVNVL